MFKKIKHPKVDKELETYRNLLETPTEFKDGFGWTTVAGIFFCGLVMMPGSIYLGLMTGGDMTSAGTWVTLILFAEIARRALKPVSKQSLVVLLHAANIMMGGSMLFPGGPLAPLVYRSYLVTSDAVRDAGMQLSFPSWFVPPPDSQAILERNLLHIDFAVPIALVAFVMFIGLIKKYTLGYFLFRITSDVEKLAFPLAPIAAQGAMALAEEQREGGISAANKAAAEREEHPADRARPPSGSNRFSRWRLFTFGVCLGIIFGMVQVGVPAITGLFLEKPIFLIPQPFIDTTILTQGALPATPTGVTFDLGIVMLGMVIPFWAVIGSFIAIIITVVMNPVLYHYGVLDRWQPGMDTVNTTFSNNIDFWMSFSIGAGVGIAVVSLFSTIRGVRAKILEVRQKKKTDASTRDVWATPKGRGDYPLWIALAGYVAAATAMIWVVHLLVPQFPMLFLILFSFVYSPFVSYVNARLLGIAGQTVEIPFIREGAFLVSGAKGVDVWLAPIPIENYGHQAQSFRVNELTGVSFWSLFKAELVALPVLFLLSLFFWSFIWNANAVPSEAFPNAQVRWELMTKQQALLYSSTFVPPGTDPADHDIRDSEFMNAVHPGFMGGGFAMTVLLFILLSTFGLPVMLIYGLVRGIGDLPHYMMLEVVGALVGRFYFQKKFGEQNFLRMAPTVLAGYFTGVGLIGMSTIALKLIQQAVSGAPF